MRLRAIRRFRGGPAAHLPPARIEATMFRIIGAVVLGYVAMAVVVFAGLSAAYLVLTADLAFQPGTYDVSMVWIAASVVVGFGAAFLGGSVARTIAGHVIGPRALAVAVVILGIGLALPVILGSAPTPGPRVGSPGIFEAMQSARTPILALLLNPLIGAIGVLIGGRALGRAPNASAQTRDRADRALTAECFAPTRGSRAGRASRHSSSHRLSIERLPSVRPLSVKRERQRSTAQRSTKRGSCVEVRLNS
jgi:hypothetical protein